MLRTALGFGLARALSIGLFILSARTLSTFENSRFIFAIALPQLTTQLATLGWLPLIRREIARVPETPSGLVRGFILRSFQIPLAAAALASLGLFGFGAVWGTNGGPGYFALLALLALLQAASSILREYLAALSMPALGFLFADSLPVALACLGLWVLMPQQAEQPILVFALGTLFAAGLQGLIVFLRLKAHLHVTTAVYKTREWVKYGLFSLVGFGGRALIDRLDIIFLGAVSFSASLALFNSTMRITGLLLLAPVIMLPVFSPLISRAHQNDQGEQLRRDMVLQTALIALAVLPFVALLLAFPTQITTTVFGPDYKVERDLWLCVIASQVFFAFSIPWGNFFLMTNGERMYGLAHLVALALALGIAATRIATMGMMAVAIGIMAANAVLLSTFAIGGILQLRQRRAAG